MSIDALKRHVEQLAEMDAAELVAHTKKAMQHGIAALIECEEDEYSALNGEHHNGKRNTTAQASRGAPGASCTQARAARQCRLRFAGAQKLARAWCTARWAQGTEAVVKKGNDTMSMDEIIQSAIEQAGTDRTEFKASQKQLATLKRKDRE
jgi:hypothetical protein